MKGVRCTIDNEGCTVYDGQYGVYGVQWTMKGVRCTMDNEGCTMDNEGCTVYDGQ